MRTFSSPQKYPLISNRTPSVLGDHPALSVSCALPVRATHTDGTAQHAAFLSGRSRRHSGSRGPSTPQPVSALPFLSLLDGTPAGDAPRFSSSVGQPPFGSLLLFRLFRVMQPEPFRTSSRVGAGVRVFGRELGSSPTS